MPSSPPHTASREVDLSVRNGAAKEPDEADTDNTTTNTSLPEEEERDETDDAQTSLTSVSSEDPNSRLEAMQQERDNLHAEVTQLRQSLESLQEKHDEELSTAQEELAESNQGKSKAELQYRNLLDKVNQIKAQLGERLKADAAELEQAREKIEELERSNSLVEEENGKLQERVAQLNSDVESQSNEIQSVRSRTTLSANNWAKERDDLISQEAYIREEYEVAKQAMQDWEILATEERAKRETAQERAQELEEQLSTQREAYERAKTEAETQGGTVDGLQRALRDVQEERKKELRDLVEQSQTQLDTLRAQAKSAEDAAAELTQRLADTQAELDRALPFEKEVKEKNLLIGKLRHEGVILNDHLTKALRFLKRGKPEDNVDRQLVTNHFLHFLALDRSDPKKFQVLQLIAALLAWNEQQKEQAGLLRQGSNNESLRVPMSPFRRTPSTPALSTDFMGDSQSAGATSKESLAELWSEFLEREAESGSVSAGGSRRGSVVRGQVRSPSLASVSSPTLTATAGAVGTFPRSNSGFGMKKTESKEMAVNVFNNGGRSGSAGGESAS